VKCEECKFNYPKHLISVGICGICALENSNRVHGIKRTKFNGEIAEEMRLGAIAHRAKRAKEERS
jgi:hypothetical protein